MASPLIQVERTPNPEALRILPGRQLMAGAPLEFRLGDDCKGAPLAGELLEIDGIKSVMLAPDFVTVVRSSPDHDWASLKPFVLAVVAEFLLSDRPAVVLVSSGERDFGDDLVSAQIHEVIERFVRPLLARDGGEATLERFDTATGIAYVRMGGACGGCPSGTTTLKRGIEQTIKRYVPEVTRVESTEGTPAVADPKARFRAWAAARWGRG